MQVEPVTPSVLVDRLVERVTQAGSGRLRVILDGAGPTGPGALADALVEPLRARGRPVVRVRARDFLRPASVRLEYGRHDPDALLDDWLDVGALNREVLDPLGPGGTGVYLPALWDAASDRSARAHRVPAADGTVLLLDGTFLLGRGLPADLTVHLAVRPQTLARLTPAEDAWQLPAYERYARETTPEAVADVVVRVDDPRRPGIVTRR